MNIYDHDGTQDDVFICLRMAHYVSKKEFLT